MYSNNPHYTHANTSADPDNARVKRRPRVFAGAAALTLGLTLAIPTAAVAEDITPILDAPVEGYGPQAPDVCSGVYSGVLAAQDILESEFGNQSPAAGRACSGGGWMSNHSKGLALDWFVNSYTSAGRAEAQSILDWLFEPSTDGTENHVRLRRLGINEIIWDRKIWTAHQPNATSNIGTWQNYNGCTTGSDCTHERHIHFSFSVAGGTQQTSWWSEELEPYRDTSDSSPVTLPQPTFEPTQDLTYGDYAQWLYRLADAPKVKGDFTSSGTARAAVWLDAAGVEGFDARFDADAIVTRSDYARILHAFDGLDGLRRDVSRDHADMTFADVDGDHPDEEQILWLARNGIGTEYRTAIGPEYRTAIGPEYHTDGPQALYDPDDPMSRQDAALFLHRFANEPEVEPYEREPYGDIPAAPYRDAVLWMWDGHIDRNRFGDVPLGHDFFAEIEWAIREGITTGDEGDLFGPPTFNPSDTVTRQEMAAFLYRAKDAEADLPESATFSDVASDHSFYAEIEWLASEGVDSDEDGTFRPQDPVTRQDLARFLYRSQSVQTDVPDVATFSDVSVYHPFYAEVEWMAGVGLVHPETEGTFRPEDTVSRGEMAAFLHGVAPEPEHALVESAQVMRP